MEENFLNEERILDYLKKGFTQEEISLEVKKLGYTPNSLSYIEKELKKIKKRHGAKTLFHLACIVYNK